MKERISVLLVDDHAILRSGLRALIELEKDLTVVGESDTGEDALDKVAALAPDVVVMDLDMPGMGGFEATRRITSTGGTTRVLALTSRPEEEALLPVLEAGGSGYVHKRSADYDVMDAIRTVARQEVFLYPRSAKLLLQGFRSAEKRGEASPLESLSDREREVLTLSAEGFSSAEIGKKLFLSPKTVETYRFRMMQKLGLAHRSELVQFALRHELLK